MLQKFFSQLLPEGLTVVSTIDSGKCRNIVCSSISEMTVQVTSSVLMGVDCYFGLGALYEKSVLRSDGKKGTRVNQNIKDLKCFFADIDVDSDDPRKYPTQEAALEAVDTFVLKYNFPSPMVVSSGGGLHIYWPLTDPVGADKWRQAAKMFKSGLMNGGLLIDPTRTADACSILRVPGTKNIKRDRPVAVLRECQSLQGRQFLEHMKALPIGNVQPSKALTVKTPFNDLKSNLVPTYAPSQMALIVETCGQLGQMLEDGGINEPTWYAGLGVARHTTSPDEDAVLISEAHDDYNKSVTLAKLHQVDKTAVGPTTCAKFNECNPGICTLCPKWGKITSPIQLGVDKSIPAPSIVVPSDDPGVAPISVELPKPPKPYVRDADGIHIQIDGDRIPIYGRDFYPIKRFHDEKIDSGVTVWRAHLPFEGTVDLQIEQGLLADPKALHKYLLSQHIAVMPGCLKHMVAYMIAYIKQLQDQARTEKLLARLGWRDNKSFVLGSKIYDSSGLCTSHKMSSSMPIDVPGMDQNGTLEGWKDTIQFYNTDEHEPHRMMLYMSLASPLFHMTGHKGALVFATGKSGAGKTTVLKAINTVWGHPEKLLHRASSGGMTENAMYGLFSLHNNLPVSLDEMTNLQPAVFSNAALGISQGQGKLRSTRTGELSKLIEAWALLVFSTSNDDAYSKVMQNRGAAAAEAMRILQIQFPLNTRYSKKEADYFANVQLQNHYGHAGHVYIPWVTANYDKIKTSVLRQIDRIGDKAKIVSSERFWAGMIGSAAVAGSIARHNELLSDFPIEKDIMWMVDQLSSIRRQIADHTATPVEVISEFLEAKLGETLVVSCSARSQDVRVEQAPRGALSVRIDKDSGHAFLMKSQFRDYCVEMGVNFGEIQEVLQDAGILLDKSALKVLGAGTDFGRGQVRCWLIDMFKLGAYAADA